MKNRWRKLLALMLASAMTLQQGSVLYAAENVSVVSQDNIAVAAEEEQITDVSGTDSDMNNADTGNAYTENTNTWKSDAQPETNLNADAAGTPDGENSAAESVENTNSKDDAESQDEADPEDDADPEGNAAPGDDANSESNVDPEDEANPGDDEGLDDEADSEDEAAPEDEADPEDDANSENDANSEDEAIPEDDADPEEDMNSEEDPESETEVLIGTLGNIEVTVSFAETAFDGEAVELALSEVSPEQEAADKSLIEDSLDEATLLVTVHGLDISFINEDGDEVEPHGSVKVEINFTDPIAVSSEEEVAEVIATAEGESTTETEPGILVIGADDTSASTAQEDTEPAATEWKLFHITTAQQVEDLTNAAATDIETTADAAVDAAAFEMDSFSVVYFAETADISGETTINTANDLKTNLQAGNDVILLSDIVLPADLSYFWLDKSVTLYLNGHSITTTNDYNNSALFAVKGTATFTIDAGDGDYSAAQQYAGSTPVISGFGTGNVIEAAEGTTVTVKGVTFQGNKGTVVKAGGSSGAAAAVTIENCTFTNNGSSSSYGGGIYASYSEVSVSGSTFTGNTADRGGAIYAEYVTSLSLTGNTIASNTAVECGGGLYLDNVRTVALGSGNAANTIEQNKASVNGGGIYARESSIDISGGTIDKNEAGSQGGGIYVSGTSTLTMSGGSISDNTCKIDSGWNLGGGGVRADGSVTFTLSGGEINRNYSLLGGGGILLTGGSSTKFTMTGGSVSNNAAWYGEGGGISISCTATITGGSICNNASGYDLSGTANASYPHWGGGGIFVSDQGGVLTLVGASITSNSAGGFGGGVAGCATGAVFMFEDGAYIAGNSASGANTSGGESAKSEDHEYAANNAAFMAGGYDDYFCALNSYVSTVMLGVDEGWTGTADYEAVDYYNGGAYGESGSGTYVTANTMMGLTAKPSGSPTGVSVTISGNKSYTHGGGVLCNGTIYVGKPDGKTLELGDRLKLTLYKALNIPLEYEFTFTLTEETTDNQGNPEYTVLHTDTNKTSATEKTGEIAFEPLTFNEAGTYTYYMEESAAIPSELDKNEVTMSDAVYKLVVTVTDQDLSGYAVTTIWHKATAVDIYQKNVAGEWELLTDSSSVPSTVSLSSDEHHYGSITIGTTNAAAFTNEVTTPQKTESNQGTGAIDEYGNIIYDKVALGETITYNISYYNDSDTAATVVIKDQLDPGVDYVENSAQIRGAYDSSTGEYAWENADTKAVYDDATHTLTFTINAEAYEYGKVRFRVKVNVKAFDAASPSVDNTASVQVGNESEVTTNTVTNKMDTVEISVKKEWKDADNEYDTRAAYAVTLTGTIVVYEDDGQGKSATTSSTGGLILAL